MKAAIIGCGYVGSAIARLWSEDGVKVTATTTTPDRVSELSQIADRGLVAKGNEIEALSAVLAGQEIALFCMSSRGSSYEESYLQTSRNLASLLPEFPHLKQVIYTGSYGIYGDRNGEWVTEENPIFPGSDRSKILTQTEEIFLGATNENSKVCVLRLGGIYGPNRELIKIFRRSAGTTRPGSGKGITNWIHLDDIVGAIDFAMKQQLQGLYNVVDGLHLTRKELLDRIMEKHNLPKVSWDASQSVERPNVKVSNQKLKDAGYSFIYPQLCDADT